MALEDYKNIIQRCFRCGYCRLTYSYSQFNCPSYDRFRLETYSPGGMMWLIRAWMKKDIEWTDSLAKKILYSCATCNNCVEQYKFPFSDDIVNIITAARQEMVENGLVLPMVRRFFENVEAYSNPYRELRVNRGKWAKGTKIKQYRGEEFLYYVGCVGSYDTGGQEIARALGDVLLKAGLSFGILGSEEECDGNEVNILGEKRLFGTLVEKNTEIFNDLGVKKIVTLSPHSYNAFKKYYPGRLVERNRENAFCCGGGSGDFYIDFFGGGEYSPRVKLRMLWYNKNDLAAFWRKQSIYGVSFSPN